MPKKRKNRGRGKGGKGKEQLVQCDICGALVPRSKAKKITKRISFVDPQLEKELRKQGTVIPTYTVTRYVCIKCAIALGIVKVRSKNERKVKRKLKV